MAGRILALSAQHVLLGEQAAFAIITKLRIKYVFKTFALGMIVESGPLIPKRIAYAIDTAIAGIMLLRRDVTLED